MGRCKLTLELLEKAPESLIAAGVRSAFVPRNRAVIVADRGSGSVTHGARTGPARNGWALPLVWPNIHAAYDGRIEPEVLLHGTPATILDRGATLDDAGGRSGPTLGRLLESVSRERARCLRRHSDLTDIPDS